ncbi:hypothetical protein Plec18167_002070 [Paecilomyces lecythidis]|uniref:BTB domain-containing protein n=1 Tax=Paecilomyces lecythidis TaxID=3004212 RepID=A0ABR3Y973_9EURO
MADYKRIIRSSHFIFVVGQERTPLTIHSAILQNLSEPLYALINNGVMKESTARLATLNDVETDTFIAFCEYAYTGAYATPDRPSVETSADEPDKGPANDQDTKVDVSLDILGYQAYPETSIERNDSWGAIAYSSKKKKLKGKKSCWNKPEPSYEPEPEPESVQVNIIYPYERLWEEFRSRAFQANAALLSPNPDIIFHAKLCVFATKYLVEPLRQQCLRSLHRDLSNFSLNGDNVSIILDLLEFTYTNTGRYEPGGKSPLRDLVIHFVACEARTLGDNEKFTEILDSNAEMGSDLVAKLVK